MPFLFTFDDATGHAIVVNGSTEIPDDAFQSRDDVTSVSIPDSVTTIGDWAFDGAGLTSVVIPDSVTSIGMYAFDENNLGEVVIGNSVSSIGSNAFAENNLEEVVIPSSVTSIGRWAFWANNLTTVVIPDSVTSLYDYAFASNSLNEVDLGNSVTSIGNNAFLLNNLTEIIIPDSVTSIGEEAFYFNNLTNIVIPNSVTSIGDDAFGNNELTEVELPGHFENNPPYDAFDDDVNFTFNYDGIPVDLNGDGFVDEITNYQMWTVSGGVDLKNRRGKTYSDDSSRMWDAIKAVETNVGFLVLVEGHRNKEGKYIIVSADDEGVVGGKSRWLNGNQMTNEGYEELFAMDFNGNGVVDLV